MTTCTLYRASDRDEVIDRIGRLRPDTPAKWGKMNAAQMLAHCQVPLRVASGELKLERGFIGILFGSLAKKKLLGPGGFKPNSPTGKEFIVRDARDFARERDALLALIRRHSEAGPAGLTKEQHPFFGPMNTEEWEALMWKHLDHHLRQFGA